MNDAHDLVVRNARLWTAGRECGYATELAVRDGRISAICQDGSCGPAREVIDAGGRVVVPGLIDAHTHMLDGGVGLGRLDLRTAGSREEFLELIRAYSSGLDRDAWVEGGQWTCEAWPDPTLPRKEWLDEAAEGRPALLMRADMHSAVASSAALKLAGISRERTDDPPGGVIDRGPDGEPTGVLRETAIWLVAGEAPRRTDEQSLRALRAAMSEANRLGLTAVADIPMLSELHLYPRLARHGDLSLRFFVYPVVSDLRTELEEVNSFEGRRGWVEVPGIKQFMDGSLGSRTAYMREPFLNSDTGQGPGWRGVLTEEAADGRLERNLALAHEAGLQTMTHAIGDEANSLLLDMLVRSIPDLARSRARCEHAQHLLAEDIPRFAELGVIASMQPYHKADDGRFAERFLGTERSRLTYAFGSLIRSGAHVPFGSDWPVAPLSPFLGIGAAVTGLTLGGELWNPQENLTVSQALECYTAEAAYSVFAENEVGRLEVGLRADFEALNSSPFDPDPDWAGMRPEFVYVEGRRVV